ncbi:MAG: hypothetical protein M3Y87_05255 [Myxococcota bacterium]|nr:hypothetical protein [Myxococcota bacterium]
MRTSSLALVASALLALGCSTEDPGPGATVLAEGRWVGELESGYLHSGSSMIVIEIERARVGEPVVGHVVFGAGEAPSLPPTDPEVGWPPGIDPQIGAVPVADGFVYESTGGTRTGDQVRIELAATELWAPWCEIQTPFQITTGSDEAQCLPNRPWTATPFDCHLDADDTSPELPVDCLKLALCRRTRVCACTTAGCNASPNGLTMYVDLLVTDDSAVGSIVWASPGGTGGANGTARVRLTRAE